MGERGSADSTGDEVLPVIDVLLGVIAMTLGLLEAVTRPIDLDGEKDALRLDVEHDEVEVRLAGVLVTPSQSSLTARPSRVIRSKLTLCANASPVRVSPPVPSLRISRERNLPCFLAAADRESHRRLIDVRSSDAELRVGSTLREDSSRLSRSP